MIPHMALIIIQLYKVLSVDYAVSAYSFRQPQRFEDYHENSSLKPFNALHLNYNCNEKVLKIIEKPDVLYFSR